MKKFLLLSVAMVLLGCSQKQIAFTDYIVENLLRDNLGQMATPPLFDVVSIDIQNLENDGDHGSASVDVRLRFPKNFNTVTQERQLQPDDQLYRQLKASFGEFKATEEQVHHAKYHFQRIKKKWHIQGSQALKAPRIYPAVESSSEVTVQ